MCTAALAAIVPLCLYWTSKPIGIFRCGFLKTLSLVVKKTVRNTMEELAVLLDTERPVIREGHISAEKENRI